MCRILQEKSANVKPLLRPFWNKKSDQDNPKSYKQMRIILIWRQDHHQSLWGRLGDIILSDDAGLPRMYNFGFFVNE